MCTILTIDREHFQYYSVEFLDRLDSDALYNDDGFAALVMGKDEKDVSIIRNMRFNTFKKQLLATLMGSEWERVWIHCRMATTAFVNVAGTHGFIGDKYAVFHNGVLSAKESDYYNVDSMLISDKLEYEDVEDVLKYLHTESYANVFIVDLETGEYHVSRSISGTLFTDGYGNYSTNAIAGVIDTPVAQHSQSVFPACVEEDTYKHSYRHARTGTGVFGKATSMVDRRERVPAWADDDDMPSHKEPKVEGVDELLAEANIPDDASLLEEDMWYPHNYLSRSERMDELEKILANNADDEKAWREYQELMDEGMPKQLRRAR